MINQQILYRSVLWASGLVLATVVPSVAPSVAAEPASKVMTLQNWQHHLQQPATSLEEWQAQLAQQPSEPTQPNPSPINAVDDTEEEITITGERSEDGYRVPRSNTGTRTDTPLRDIPQAIQVIPQQILQDRGVNSVGEALENVSGVVQRDAAGSIFGDLFTIRGFLIQSGITSNIFRDGLPYVVPGKLNTDDIEQVEVLKGPASILFGAGQPGGVVNLLSKKPLLNPYYSAELTIGNFNTYRGSLDFSGPIDEQKRSGYRLNVSYENLGSYRDFVKSNRFAISPSITAALGKNTTLDIYAQVITESETADEGIPVIGDRIPDLPRSLFLGEDFSDVSSTTFNIGYRLEHKLNDSWTLRNASQYLFFEFDRYYPILDSFDETTGDVSRTAYATSGKYHRLTTSADVVGKFSTGSIAHTLLFGAEYRYGAENPAFQFSTAYDSINLFSPIYTGRRFDRAFEFFRDDNYSTFAAYLQDQIALTSNLKLLAGVRYESARQFRTTQELGFDREEFRQTDSAWSPRVGLIYQPSPAISLYTSYSRSFAPSFGASRNFDSGTFEPETGRQFEVGMKADLSDRLSLTIAAYDLRKQNVQTPDPNNRDFTLQTGEQTSRGIEVDLAGRILPGWNVIASYAYTDAFVSRDNNFPVGNRLSEVPYNQASLFTTYEFQQGALKGVGLGVGLFYVGDRQGDLSNTYTLPSYLRTDAMVYYKRDNWKAQLNVRNLFNTTYFVSNFGDRFVTPSAPLSISGTLSVQF
jgi:iron complex outermembrane recepter protein